MDWLWALLFLGFGIGMIFHTISGAKSGIKSVSWPSTDGRITRSEIVWSTDSGDAKISYVYEVCGKSYLGNVRDISLGDTDSSRSPKKIISKYPLGAHVKVYYDPSKPDVSTLKTGLSIEGVVAGLITAGLFIFFGIKTFQGIFGR